MKKVILTQDEIEVIEINARGRDALSRSAYHDYHAEKNGPPKFGYNNMSYWGWLAEFAVAKHFNIYPDITWACDKKTKHYDLIMQTGQKIDVKMSDFYKDAFWVRPKTKEPDHYLHVKMKRHEVIRDSNTGQEKKEYLVLPEFYLAGHIDMRRFHQRAFFHRKTKCYVCKQENLLTSFPKNIFGHGTGS